MTRDDIKEEFGVTCPHSEPCDCLVDGADFMADEILKLRAAIERVRALHAPIEIASKKFCDECKNETEYWVVPHQCRTLRALDGEDA
jgi:hypothetical protein